MSTKSCLSSCLKIGVHSIYSKHKEILKQESLSSISTEKIVPTERQTYSLDELEKISSIIQDFVFFVQPKYKIASARPGSGNTRNIGSVVSIGQLVNGTGPFASLGEDIYDDYWMNYLNKDMARKLEIIVPYYNLETYATFKSRGVGISIEQAQQLDQIDTGPGKEDVE